MSFGWLLSTGKSHGREWGPGLECGLEGGEWREEEARRLEKWVDQGRSLAEAKEGTAKEGTGSAGEPMT